jgi:hypothetical protein
LVPDGHAHRSELIDCSFQFAPHLLSAAVVPRPNVPRSTRVPQTCRALRRPAGPSGTLGAAVPRPGNRGSGAGTHRGPVAGTGDREGTCHPVR